MRNALLTVRVERAPLPVINCGANKVPARGGLIVLATSSRCCHYRSFSLSRHSSGTVVDGTVLRCL